MLHTSIAENSYPVTPPIVKDIRTLLLDDSNFDRARIRRLSAQTELPIHIDEVNSIAELDNAVDETSYDLILIDYRLPVGDGLIALDHIQKAELNKDAGKIMITGNGAVDTAVQAMRGGCHDFLDKDEMNAALLRTAVLNVIAEAKQRQFFVEQAEQHREIIRDGLLAALQDDVVQGNVVSMVKRHFGNGKPNIAIWESDDLGAMISGLSDEDDFVFH